MNTIKLPWGTDQIATYLVTTRQLWTAISIPPLISTDGMSFYPIKGEGRKYQLTHYTLHYKARGYQAIWPMLKELLFGKEILH